MKLVKQRFSIWYSRSHKRFGTLWAKRFKSVLVEAKAGVMRTMAAYINLNPVRIGLVDDPKGHRFCGYAEAVAGNPIAQRGLRQLGDGSTDKAGSWTLTTANAVADGRAPRRASCLPPPTGAAWSRCAVCTAAGSVRGDLRFLHENDDHSRHTLKFVTSEFMPLHAEHDVAVCMPHAIDETDSLPKFR